MREISCGDIRELVERIEEAEREYREGKTLSFASAEELDRYIRSRQ